MAKKVRVYDVYIPLNVLFTVSGRNKEDAIQNAFSQATRKELMYKIENDIYEFIERKPYVEFIEVQEEEE